MSKKVAIIGAGAAAMAAVTQITGSESGSDISIDIFDGRCQWGGRVKSLPVGDEMIDFGAEAIENATSKWPALLKKGTENLEWKNLMSKAQTGLYWANGEKQTSHQAIEAEGSLWETESGAVIIANNRIDELSEDQVAVNIHAIDSANDLIQTYIEFTCQESIEPWIFSAKDRSRFDSESSENYPYLSTTEERLTLGQIFENYGKYLAATFKDQVSVKWSKTISTVDVSDAEKENGFSLTDDSKLKHGGYDAVLLTVPVPLLTEISLPHSLDEVVEDSTDGIELGYYLKIAWPWKSAVEYFSNGEDDGFGVWLADPEGNFVWRLQSFPESEVLIASTAGAYAHQCELDLDSAASNLKDQIQAVIDLDEEPDGDFETYSWTQDPLATGCYSYCLAGSAKSREDFSNLSFKGIYFAGEAMSVDLYGQLDGAYQTGISAANDILDYLDSE